ncbi:hypothetical protein ACFYTQ_03510 [Nocardia sp. NPDC004068]|uniref:hypothetical protein n=1 Tax=Nocardia sp. NPDC004068 TaxID=3364303 RepID=UPI0036CC162B
MVEWNDRLEEQYRRYGGEKWMRGLPARGRQNWYRARTQWQRVQQKGNRFRDGMALLRGQTPARGYQKEVRLETSLGLRIADVANVTTSRSSEYKAGGAQKDTTLQQLAKDERYIRETPGASVDWTIVQGARIDKEVHAKLRELEAKYPGQFKVQEISREQLRLALTVGKNLEKRRLAKEKEVRELEKAKEEKRRQDEKTKALEKRKEALARTVKEKTRQLAIAEEKSLAIDAGDVTRTHKSVTKEIRSIRKAERSHAKAVLRDMGLNGEQAKAMEEVLARGRENQRRELTRGIEAMRKTAEREARAQAAREAASRWQRQQLELAKQRGYAPELRTIMELMNQGRPAPGIPLPGAPVQAPEVVRDGRAKQHALELERRRGLEPRAL